MAIQLLPEEEFRASIPAELREVSRSKDADKSEQGFPHRLWKILQWVGNDQVKRTNMGCGWMTENEFFIEKSRFCQILEIKLNTLNFNVHMSTGTVSVNGNALGSDFTQMPAPANGTISVKAEKGSLTLTDPPVSVGPTIS